MKRTSAGASSSADDFTIDFHLELYPTGGSK